METQRFIRRQFQVDAVQVTSLNMEEVAEWCKGRYVKTDRGIRKIEIELPPGANERQAQAFIGDWVLMSAVGVRVYKNKSFQNVFAAVPSREDKRNFVLQMVISAMARQDVCTYHGAAGEAKPYADVATDKIMEIF